MANADYTSLGPPPLATPITLNGDDHGIPFQDRGVPRGDLQVGWAQWFNKIWTRMVVLLDAVLGAASLTHVGAIPKVSAAGTLAESAITDTGTAVDIAARSLGLDNGGNFAFQIKDTGGTYRSLIGLNTTTWGATTGNIFWIRNPIAASDIYLAPTGNVVVKSGNLGPGGNLSTVYPIDTTGDTNTSGVYRVGGTQVVTSRQAAITSPSIATSNTASTAGATYTATEQGMLNQFKTSIGQLNTDVGNLQAAVNSLISTLQTHGLTS